MNIPEENLDAVIHNVIKKYMSKRQQGRCMAELREALGLERSSDRHLTVSAKGPESDCPDQSVFEREP